MKYISKNSVSCKQEIVRKIRKSAQEIIPAGNAGHPPHGVWRFPMRVVPLCALGYLGTNTVTARGRSSISTGVVPMTSPSAWTTMGV